MKGSFFDRRNRVLHQKRERWAQRDETSEEQNRAASRQRRADTGSREKNMGPAHAQEVVWAGKALGRHDRHYAREERQGRRRARHQVRRWRAASHKLYHVKRAFLQCLHDVWQFQAPILFFFHKKLFFYFLQKADTKPFIWINAMFENY